MHFTDEAAEAIAREALQRKVGARGLRMILEELMLDLMYHMPGQQEGEGARDHRGDGEDSADLAAGGCWRRPAKRIVRDSAMAKLRPGSFLHS